LFEALTHTLPDWYALQWSEASLSDEIPPEQMLRDKDVVIIVDDLQNYSSEARLTTKEGQSIVLSGSASSLRHMIEKVGPAARRTVIVVTCREERERGALASVS
jgi:hypothetical protein